MVYRLWYPSSPGLCYAMYFGRFYRCLKMGSKPHLYQGLVLLFHLTRVNKRILGPLVLRILPIDLSVTCLPSPRYSRLGMDQDLPQSDVWVGVRLWMILDVLGGLESFWITPHILHSLLLPNPNIIHAHSRRHQLRQIIQEDLRERIR